MPVLTPYMISLFWIFSSSRARHFSIRFLASGERPTGSLRRATLTTFSMVRFFPSRMMDMIKPPRCRRAARSVFWELTLYRKSALKASVVARCGGLCYK